MTYSINLQTEICVSHQIIIKPPRNNAKVQYFCSQLQHSSIKTLLHMFCLICFLFLSPFCDYSFRSVTAAEASLWAWLQNQLVCCICADSLLEVRLNCVLWLVTYRIYSSSANGLDSALALHRKAVKRVLSGKGNYFLFASLIELQWLSMKAAL